MSDFEILSMRRISELPFAADEHIFRNYPGFKLGVTRCVRYYASLLLPLVKEIVANDSRNRDWVLTSPGLAAQTPAGANFLCWELFDLYRRERDTVDSGELSLIDIQYKNEATAAIDYAKLDLAARVTERERLSRRLVSNGSFRGRSIVFINDACITGAQQVTMQQYFERAEADSVKWLYIFFVDPELGRREPTIEWRINFAPFGDLLRMLSYEPFQFTGKCVLRLMNLSVAELDQVLRVLDAEHRTRLLELALRNGFQNLNGFHEQIDLVRSYVTERTTSAGNN